MMMRMLGSTAVLMAITLASKLIGFVRELVLLETLGIGAQLDIFVVLYGLVMLLSGALGICIVTSLTPIAGQYTTREETLSLLGEGMRAGIIAGLAALAASVMYALMSGGVSGGVSGVWADSWPIALIVPLVVPFAVVAEYQAALFLSRGQRLPVIAGNLILSLPLVAALLLFDVGIVLYAAGLAATFMLRALIFTGLLLKGRDVSAAVPAPRAAALFSKRVWPTLSGGSATLAMAALALTAPMAAREIATGQAAMVAYGMKVPQLIITSVWFVLGTGFFADLVTRGTAGAQRRIAVYCAVNGVLAAILFGAVRGIDQWPAAKAIAGDFEMARVIGASGPFLPLIVLIPLIEMTQRLLVTDDRHRAVLSVTIAVLTGGLMAQAAGFASASMPLIAWSPSVGGLMGGAVCVMLLLRHSMQDAGPASRGAPRDEEAFSHAPS